MLRVMLVDDEPLALEGLRLLIDWRTEGFTICAECASANEALAKLATARPDLIVTDIRMAGMDGLTMMRAARQAGCDAQFVVVSGYGDFEYAQQALRLGVAGYLLKPIDPDEASDVLEHVRHKLVNREIDATDRFAGYQRRMTAYLSGQSVSTADFPDAERWLLATWGAPLPYERVRELFTLLGVPTATAHIVEDKEWIAVPMPQNGETPTLDAIQPQLRLLRRAPHQCLTTLAELPEARRAIAADMDDCDAELLPLVSELVRTVSLRQPEAFAAQAAILGDFCASHGSETLTRAKRRLLSGCASQLADRPDAMAELLSTQSGDLNAIGACAMRLLAPSQARVSDRVEDYVQPRLAKRLTLESVADALGYNATYLGRVFRDERGEGFREWLSKRRVERAAELLRQTDEPVAQIAEQVGYMQYKRFLEHFKRRFGKTPEQYRRR